MANPKGKNATDCHFEVEVLEPRILFSADGLCPAEPTEPDTEIVVVESLQDDGSTAQSTDTETLFDAAEDTFTVEVDAPVSTPDSAPQTDADPAPEITSESPVITGEPLPVTEPRPAEPISKHTASTVSPSPADWAADSLNTAHGPPQLTENQPQSLLSLVSTPTLSAGDTPLVWPTITGLNTPDATADTVSGQVFYLDTDGVTDLAFRDTTLSLPAFGRPDLLPEIVADLSSIFSAAGACFTTTQPAGTDFSTIHLGDTDAALDLPGAYLGLAEHVDTDNVHKSDIAVVFAQSVLRDNPSHTALVDVIAEEAAHLLGYTEANPVADPSSPYAAAQADNRIVQISQSTAEQGTAFDATVAFSARDTNPAGPTTYFVLVDLAASNGWSLGATPTATLDSDPGTTITATNPDAGQPELFAFEIAIPATGIHHLTISTFTAPGAVPPEEQIDTITFSLTETETGTDIQPFQQQFTTTASAPTVTHEVPDPVAERAELSPDSVTADLASAIAAGSVAGVTVVTHGFQPPGAFFSSAPIPAVATPGDSLYSLAEAIQQRTGGWLIDVDIAAENQPSHIDGVHSVFPDTNAVVNGDLEVVVLFDWAEESNEMSSRWSAAAGDALFALLVRLGLVDPTAGAANLPFHFIGHSFGTAVTSEAVRLFATHDIPVDHLTYLDPHDFDESGIPIDQDQRHFELATPAGYGVAVWENVTFADAYFQTHYLTGGPSGRPIPGAFNVDLTDDLPAADLSGTQAHSLVWTDFYTRSVTFPAEIGGDDEHYGYYYSRVGNGNTAYTSPGLALRPEPRFFSDDPTIDGNGNPFTAPGRAIGGTGTLTSYHSHSNTPPGLVNADGTPDASIDAATIRTAKWQADRPILALANGDFQGSGDGTIAPGWSHHGGGGTGVVANGELTLANGHNRTHNTFYLPETAGALTFTARVPDDTATGSLFVTLDLPNVGATTSKIIAEFDIADLTTTAVRLGAVIPAEYRGTAATFTVSASIFSPAEATVVLDDFNLTHAVLNGDIATFDLRHLGEGTHDGTNTFSLITLEPVANTDLSGTGGLGTFAFSSSQPDIWDYTFNGENAGTLIYPQAIGGIAFSTSGTFHFGAPLGDNIPGDIDTVTPGYQGFLSFSYSVDGGATGSFLVYVADGFTADPLTKDDVGGTFFNATPDGLVIPTAGTELDLRVTQRLLHRGFDPAPVQELVDALHGITGFQPDATNLVDPLIDHAEGPGWTLVGGTHQSTWSADIIGSGGVESHLIDSHDASGNSNFGPLIAPIDDAVTPADDFFLNPYQALDAAVDIGVDAYGFFKEVTVNTLDYVVAKTDAALDFTQAAYDHVVGIVSGASATVEQAIDATGELLEDIVDFGTDIIGATVRGTAENVWLALSAAANGASYLVKVVDFVADGTGVIVDWATAELENGLKAGLDAILDAGALAYDLAFAIADTIATGTEILANQLFSAAKSIVHATKYLIVDNDDAGYNRSLAQSFATGFLSDDLFDPANDTTTSGTYISNFAFNDPRLWSVGADADRPSAQVVRYREDATNKIAVTPAVPEQVVAFDSDAADALKEGFMKFRPNLNGALDRIDALNETIDLIGDEPLSAYLDAATITDDFLVDLEAALLATGSIANVLGEGEAAGEANFAATNIATFRDELAAFTDTLEFLFSVDRTVPDRLDFTLDYEKTFDPLAGFELDLGAAADGFPLTSTTSVELVPSLAFTVHFGITDLRATNLLEVVYFELENLSFSLEAIAEVEVGADLGLVDLEIVDGSATLGVTLSTHTDRVTGLELCGAGFQLPTPDFDLNATLDLDLPFHGSLGAVDFTDPAVPTLHIGDLDLFDAAPPTVAAENFGVLGDLGELTWDNVGALLLELKDVVVEVLGDGSVAGATIPGLGISVADALLIADVFCDLVHDFEDTIDGGLDGLEAYLNGILPGNITVAFDYVGASLTLALQIADEVTETLSFNLDFDAFDDPALDAVGAFIDLSTSGNLELVAGYDLTLATAIDLTDPLNPAFFVLPDTVATVYASVRADASLSATVAVPGIADLQVIGGTFILDADGLAATLDDPANFTVDFDFGGAPQLTVAQLIPNISVDLDAQLTIDLPIFDGPDPLDPAQPNLLITVGDLGNLLTGDGLPGINVTPPNFAGLLPTGLDIDGLYDGFVLFLNLLRDALNGEVFGINLPFIGDQFSGAVEFLDDLIALLPADVVTGFDLIAAQLTTALAPVLDGGVTWSSADPNEEVIFDIPLGGSWGADADLDFDLGVPALGLDVDGSPGFELAWGLDLSVGVARGDGFFIVTDGALPELSLSFDADLDGFVAEGTLGFLGVSVRDHDTMPSYFTAGVSVDILDPGTAKADGRLTLSEIVGASSAPLTAIIDPEWGPDGSGSAASAEINLIIETFFDVPDTALSQFFPTLATDLHIDWDFSPAALAGGDLSDLLPAVELKNIRLDLESYFDGFIGKVLGNVRDTLAPFDDLLQILDMRLPVLSDFADLRAKWDTSPTDGRVTVLEVAPISEQTKKFLATVILINELAGSIPEGTGSVTLIDSYSLDGETLDDDGFEISQFDVDSGFTGTLNNVIGAVNGLVDDAEEFIASLGLEGPEPEETVKIDFPLFTNPLLAVKLLFGQNVDLFVLDLPVYDLEASFKASFPIFPVFPALQVGIGGVAGLTADIDFGYDTEGARRFASSNNPADLFAGFFVYDRDDRGEGKDKPEFILHAGVEATLELNALVASASVGGGLYASIEFDLDDLDGDGRFRGDEFEELFPDCLFVTTGEFTAGLFASLRVGLIKKRFDLASITLAEFSHECVRVNPDLAHIDEHGTLLLHVGDAATLRNYEPGETEETYIISQITLEDGSTTTQIQFGTATETFDGYTSIEGDFGSGDDTLTVMPEITAPITISGGSGDDSLIAGGGPAELRGNNGDDSLAGSPFADEIFGGTGNDLLTGGDGNDLLAGGPDDDVLLGGIGNDELFGEDGDDDLTGDDGSDLLEGGDGNDTLDGGRGNDELLGEGGNDTVYGDEGTDDIEGGDGNDFLLGGPGTDTIHGGDGDDTIYGNSDSEAATALGLFDIASDFLRGEDGEDFIDGNGGPDDIDGGNHDDEVRGSDGNDLVVGGPGNDTVSGGLGADLLIGDNGGTSGDDDISGDAGRDTIFGDHATVTATGADPTFSRLDSINWTGVADGGNGDDTASGGSGVDYIDGQAGDDTLSGDDGDDTIDGHAGDDTIDGGTGEDLITGHEGADTIDGGDGDDEIFGNAGNDTIDGGDGDDRILSHTGDDTVNGGDGDDDIYAGADDDTVHGDAGRDRIFGFTGDDVLNGNDGDDAIFGYDGDDTLDGGDGADTLTGGIGNDILIGGAGPDYLEGNAGDDELDGGSGDDTLLGNGGDDTLLGGDGDDDLDGGAGTDTLGGDGGEDFLFAGTGTLNELDGGDGRDTLVGSDVGDDTLLGGDGDDKLLGLGGADELRGGPGHDHLDGGRGMDDLFGEDGDDWLFGGEVETDTLDGGAGRNELHPDIIAAIAPLVDPAPVTPFETFLASTLSDVPAPDVPYLLQTPDPGALVFDPAVTYAADGTLYFAWADPRSGNFQIYVAAYAVGVGWTPLGTTSASFAGVSNTSTSSRRPTLSALANGDLAVAWAEDGTSIHASTFDGTNWTHHGQIATGDRPQLSGDTLAYLDGTTLHVGTFLGASLSTITGATGDFDLESDVAVAWSDGADVHVARAANAWATETPTTGVSPALAFHQSTLYLAAADGIQTATQGNELVAFELDGTWQPVDTDYIAGGHVRDLHFGTGGTLAFTEDTNANREGRSGQDTLAVYTLELDGGELLEHLPGQASYNGHLPGRVDAFATAPDGTTSIAVGPDVLTSAPALAATVISSTDAFTPADHTTYWFTRDSNNISVSLDGTTGITLAQLEGRDITLTNTADTAVIAPEIAVSVAADDTTGTFITHTTIGASLDITGTSDDLTITRSEVTGDTTFATVTGGHVSHNTFRNGNVGLTFSAGFTGTIKHNRVTGHTTGIAYDAAAPLVDNLVDHNETGIAVAVSGAAGGLGFAPGSGQNAIFDNLIGIELAGWVQNQDVADNFVGISAIGDLNLTRTGPQFDAADPFGLANLIHRNGLGFAGALKSEPLEIFDNPDYPNIKSLDQYVTELEDAGYVTTTTATELFFARDGGNGDVEFNRVFDSTAKGIVLADAPHVTHNLVYDNPVGIDAVAAETHIAHNTVHSGTGTAVVAAARLYFHLKTPNLEKGSTPSLNPVSPITELLNNVLATGTGNLVEVRQPELDQAFFSDYNVLHADTAAGGTLYRFVRYERDDVPFAPPTVDVSYADLLDIQADFARYELHSLGTTALDPLRADPGFRSLTYGDLTTPDLVGNDHDSRPAVDAGADHIDTGLDPATPNLLTNPSFDTGGTGWLLNASANTTGGFVHTGADRFAFAEQTVDLVAAGQAAVDIDTGTLRAVFSGRMVTGTETLTNLLKLTLTFLDGSGAAIPTPFPAVAEALRTDGRWELVGGSVDIPAGTRQITYRLDADVEVATSISVRFDDAWLRVVTDDGAPDPGAYFHTAFEATAPADTPRLVVRFPDLYFDWQVDAPHSVLWDSFDNTARDTVRIDLYQDTGSGPQFLLNITPDAPDAGRFDWIPGDDSGVLADTSGLYIHISLTNDPATADLATEPFTVPRVTDDYYVEVTANGGSNRNTGTSAADPKPHPVNLLRTYELGGGDTLHVGPGIYLMWDAITLSGSAPTPLGLDNGFTLDGDGPATTTFSHARLLPAVVHLDDADVMTLRGFATVGAEVGVLLERDTTGFLLEDVSAFGASLAGLQLDTAHTGTLRDITTSGNDSGTRILPYDERFLSVTVEGLTADHNLYHGLYWDPGFEENLDIATASFSGNGFGLKPDGQERKGRAVWVAGFNNTGTWSDFTVTGNRFGTHTVGAISLTGAEVHDNIGNQPGDIVKQGSRTALVEGAFPPPLPYPDDDDPTIPAYTILSGPDLLLEIVDPRTGEIKFTLWEFRYETIWESLFPDPGYGIDHDGSLPLVLTGANVTGHWSGISATRIELYDSTVTDNYLGVNMISGVAERNVVTGNAIGFTDINAHWFDGRPITSTTYAQGVNPVTGLTLRNNIIADNFNSPGHGGLWHDRILPHFDPDPWGLPHITYQQLIEPNTHDHYAVLFQGSNHNLGDFVFESNTVRGAFDTSELLTPSQSIRHNIFASGGAASIDSQYNLTGDPLFVPGTFHLQSTIGAYDPGSGTFVPSAGDSPAIDAGDPLADFSNEPQPNGGYLNLGAFGNTPFASLSPSPFLRVTGQEAGTVFRQGDAVPIIWRSFGLPVDSLDVAVSSNGTAGPFTTLATGQPGEAAFTWFDTGSATPSTNYVLRVSSSGTEDFTDPFTVAAPTNTYYVNDGSQVDDTVTTAPGDNANTGLTPGSPKASVQSVLDAYALAPGDTILVDTGSFAGFTVTADDAGITVEGSTVAVFGSTITLTGTSVTLTGFALDGAGVRIEPTAADATVTGLTITGASTGVRSETAAASITGNTIDYEGGPQPRSVAFAGIYVSDPTGTGLVVSGNTVTGYHHLGINFEVDRSGTGIDIDAAGYTVSGNLATDNTVGYWLLGSGESTSNNATLNTFTGYYFSDAPTSTGDTAEDNLGAGFTIGHEFVGSVNGATADSNDVGFHLAGGTLAGSTASDNTTDGVLVDGVTDTFRSEEDGAPVNIIALTATGNHTGLAVRWGENPLDRPDMLEFGLAVTVSDSDFSGNTTHAVFVNQLADTIADAVTLVRLDIVAPTGTTGVHVTGADTRYVSLLDSVLDSDGAAGIGLFVDPSSQRDFDASGNTHTNTGGAALAHWQQPFTALLAWQLETGFDHTPATTTATTFYADPSGAYTNSGTTPADPLPSLAAVLHAYAVPASSTVHVAAGNYPTVVTLTLPQDLTVDAPGATFDRGNQNPGATLLSAPSGATVGGATLTGAETGLHATSAVTLTGTVFTANTTGLHLDGGVGTVTGSTFTASGTGIFIDGTTLVLTTSTVSSNTTGLLLSAAQAALNDTSLHTNALGAQLAGGALTGGLFFGNTTAVRFTDALPGAVGTNALQLARFEDNGSAVEIDASDGLQSLTTSAFLDNPLGVSTTGSLASAADSLVILRNLTFLAGGAVHVQLVDTPNTQLTHTVFAGTGSTAIDADLASAAGLATAFNLDEAAGDPDPLFVDRAGGDVHLQPSSPAVDAGDPALGTGAEPSPNGSLANLGAYGTTADATTSPGNTIAISSPDGGSRFRAGGPVPVTWRTDGFGAVSAQLAYSDAVNAAGPLFYLPLNETAGTTAFDFGLTPHIATYRGGTILGEPGAVQGGLAPRFDGLDDSVELLRTADLNVQTFTLSAWLRPDPGIADLATGVVTSSSHRLGVDWGNGFGLYHSDGEVRFFLNRTHNNSIGAAVTLGEWVHATATYDGAEMRLYFDGVLVASKAFSEAVNYGVGSSNPPFLIGDSFSDHPWTGAIDEPALFAGAMDAAAVATLAGAGVTTPGSQPLTLTLDPENGLPVTLDNNVADTGAITVSLPATLVPGTYTLSLSVPGGPSATSSAFVVAPAATTYYINDATVAAGDLTTAPGDDANFGTDPGSPMATLAALLAAYHLGPGDTVVVDAGTYTGTRISSADAGFTLTGTAGTVFSGGDLSALGAVLRVDGAPGTVIENIEVTGAGIGIAVVSSPDSVVRGSTVHNNTDTGIWVHHESTGVTVADNSVYGTGADSQETGVLVHADRTTITGNELFKLGTNDLNARQGDYGLRVTRAGNGFLVPVDVTVGDNLAYNNRTGLDIDAKNYTVTGNTARDNHTGIRSVGGANNDADDYVVHGNTAFDNDDAGFLAGGFGVLTGNTAYGNDIGIEANATNLNTLTVGGRGAGEGNTTFANRIGIESDSHTIGNATFGNTDTGLRLNRGNAIANRVYSNASGIVARDQVSAHHILDNLIYDNANIALQVQQKNFQTAAPFHRVTNNTIVHDAGTAVLLTDAAKRIIFTNNLISIAAGTAFNIEDAVPDASYAASNNLVHLSTPAAVAGDIGAPETLFGDPLFVDLDGADNILGYDPTAATGTGADFGPDDNFAVGAGSPAIDAGRSIFIPLTDLLDAPRTDDPGTPNSGTPVLVETASADSVFVTGPDPSETDIGFNSHFSSTLITLDFAFPYFGETYTELRLFADGYITFVNTNPNGDGSNTTEELPDFIRIAPLWDNLRTTGTGDDVFETRSPDHITFRWDATNQADNSDVQFALTLYDDGRARFDYGPGNTNLTPTVGLSSPDKAQVLLASNDGSATLTNAPSLLFVPVPGSVDIGALEFGGSSSDTTAPGITGSDPGVVEDGASLTSAEVTAITLTLSEAVNPLDALAATAYSLTSSAGDVPFTPVYLPGTSEITLALAAPLGPDTYTLSIAAGALRDLAGNTLAAGYDRTFEITAGVAAVGLAYIGSAFGGEVAPDKTPLLPGGTGGFANISSFTDGITGVVVDAINIDPVAASFAFTTGANDFPEGWTDAPAPSSVTVEPGAGTAGSDRITVAWPAGSIVDTWLRIEVLPTGDTYYFGSDPGHTGGDAATAVADTATNPHGFFDPAAIDDPYDFDRDTNVNAADVAAARAGAAFPRLAEITVPSIDTEVRVLGRHLFYNNSAFGLEVAPDKTALLPGAVAGLENISNFTLGINGVAVDIAHLARDLTAADFNFRTGDDPDPANWLAAPAPVSVTTVYGAGLGGSDRVYITFADNAIDRAWLQVDLLAAAGIGLAADDTFYFGSAPGDTGNSSTDTIVDAIDAAAVLANPRGALNPAAIDNPYDVNRDSLVDAADHTFVTGNPITGNDALPFITAP